MGKYHLKGYADYIVNTKDAIRKTTNPNHHGQIN